MTEMTAAVSPSFKPTRPPSESSSTIRPKTRDVASRYLSTTNRPATPSVSSAQRMLLTSGRGLFSTFQADSFSSPTSTGRKTTSTATPRSGGEQWPRSLRPNSLSRSLDFSDTRKKPSGSSNGVARALHNSMVSNRPLSRARIGNADSSKVGSYALISDTESVSSESSSERGKKVVPARAIVAKARFLQQHHIVDPGKIPLDGPVGVATPRSQLFPKREQTRPASPSKYCMSASASRPRGASIARGISPSRGVIPSRGISPSGRISPIRVRTSLSSSNGTPLAMNYTVDAKKEKIRENGLADAHLLRLYHNRLLQWRFVNARANAVISAQKIRVERTLYKAWISIAKLYDSAKLKRIEMQLLKQNMKLISILNRQMTHLEEWAVVERDYMDSLVGAAEALKGSTLCLPLDCGAMVNVESLQDAICSAVDVMQAMASSICLLLPKVARISCLAAELGHVNVKEQVMLDVCRDLINIISALQVTECSLRTQALQLQY